jgi:PIN domain nuclease of toxin-antitoxin system
MPTVLDTHAWIWWVTKDRRLSGRARTTIERSSGRGELYLSIFSVWEMAKKVEKGQLALDRPLDEWLDAALAAEGLQLADIVATARSLEAAVVTRDERLRDYKHVRTVW